jgi:luciferase family oxidoreductase group 1
MLGAEDFPRHLIDLMGLLGDERVQDGLWQRFRATPLPRSSPWIVLLGSSGYSAQLAGMLGLPFSFAHHFDSAPRSATVQTFALYRSNFRPSPILDEPYAIVSVNALAAPTDEEAQWFAGPSRLLSLGRRTGRFRPQPSPEDAARHPDMAEAASVGTNRIVGSPTFVVDELEALADDTAANEVMITTTTHGIGERVASLTLIAEEWHRRSPRTGSG